MKKIFFVIVLLLSGSVFAQSLEIDVKLSPAGSFKAETKKIKGFAKVSGDGVSAENVLVDLRSLSTGIGLRDKHLKERLDVEKHPVAKLIKAEGKSGKGTATIELKGQKKDVAGTYQVKGKNLQAEFKMKMSDLGINDVRYMGVGAKDEVTVTIVLPVKD
ncbi:YceI family protein [bacterium]|nr:YceI family protein [bacterium]